MVVQQRPAARGRGAPALRRLLRLLLLSAAVALLHAHRPAPARGAGVSGGGGAQYSESGAYDAAVRDGERAVSAGDLGAALRHFERAAAARPDSTPALQNVGLLSLQLGDAARAESALLAALALAPRNAGLLNALGQARMRRGDLAAAAASMRASVAAETDAAARSRWAANLAAVLRASGDAAGAREAELAARPAAREQADAWQHRLDALAAAARTADSTAACPVPAPGPPSLVVPPADPAFPSPCARVAASELTPDAFLERFVRASVPVVITGALSALPAGGTDALLAGAQEEVLPVSLAFAGGATHRVLPFEHADVAAALGPRAAAWRAVVAGTPAAAAAVLRAPQSRMRLATLMGLLRTPGAPPLYAHQLPADIFLPAVLNATAWWADTDGDDDGVDGSLVSPPPFAAALRPMAAPHAWLAGAAATGLHFDRGDNLLALLSGAKRVLLLRPSEAARLRYTNATDIAAGSAGAGASVTDNHALGADAFGGASQHGGEWAAGARGLTCDVAAGEMLFIPYRWHHAVRTTPAPPPDCACLALNFWFTPVLSDAEALAAHGPLQQEQDGETRGASSEL